MPDRLTLEDLRTIVDDAPFIMAAVDPSGRIVWANRELARVVNRGAADLAGSSFVDLAVPDPRDQELAARLLASSGSGGTSFRMRSADGTPVETSWSPLLLASGLVVVMGRDVTEERALSVRLARAERLEAIGRLTGGIAHDFNNLLTVIAGNAQLLVELRQLTGPAAEEAAEIVRAADTARAVVRQLLTFSGRTPLPVQPIDVNQRIEHLRDIVARLIDPRVQMDFELAPALPPVTLEEGQVEQIVMNLLLNARDAMPGGGSVRVRTAAAAIDEPGLDLRGGHLPAGRYVTVVVSDMGPGMDAETSRRIFEPFFTTRATSGGTGLGLATVHAIVRHAGGSLDLVSAPGEGATFTIFLPAGAGTAASSPPLVMPPRMPHATILVVDDHEAVRALCRRALENDGHRVLEAADGEAALDAARRADRLDLVIADVRLRGENGRDLLQSLRGRHPEVRALVMSGYPHPKGHEGPFLEKPFTTAMLVAAVRRILAGGS